MAYCERHNRSFRSWDAYQQHVDDHSGHNVCDDCDKDFPTYDRLKQHWAGSPRHDYCQECDELFDDEDELEEHYEDEHHYCVSCKRHFQSESNLRHHLNSSTHRSRDVECPFRGCDMAFVSRAALVLHLESGKCESGMDRKTVNKYVRKYDTKNVITDPSRLITSGVDITYSANEHSWNGSAYECYLCHANFKNLYGLNQHLNSPKHAEKVYVCRGKKCGVHFNALSALFMHIESEKCGVSRFKNVQNAMDSVLGQMGRLTL